MTDLLRPYAYLEPVVDVLRLGVFLLFIALGLMAVRAADEVVARRRVGRLVAYVLAVTVGVGLTQIESWPFSNWALVHGLSSRMAGAYEIEGLDASGRGYLVDLRVLQPLPPEEIASWLRANSDRLGPAGQSRLGRFLLERAETGRVRFLAGRSAAPNERILGPFTAPHHFLYPKGKSWRSAVDVPSTPFVTLRLWRLEWDVEERLRDPGHIVRRRVLEFHGASDG